MLISTGSPAGDDVAYMRGYLSAPMASRLPACLQWLQGGLGRRTARFTRSADLGQGISTEHGSLLRLVMSKQVSALQSALPNGWRAFVGMCYGGPRIADVTREIAAAGIEELVMVPMYPQFSETTTGTVMREAYGALKEVGQHLRVTVRTTWYDDRAYLGAQAKRIAEYASRHGLNPADTHLVFAAHGLSVSYANRDDPYASQVEQSAALVAQRLGWPADRSTVAYQSRTGAAEWLKPDVREVLSELSDAGERRLLVCPMSVTMDCPETLEEIDVRCRAAFESRGGDFHVCPALNDYGPFVDALKNLALRGPQPVTSWGADSKPYFLIINLVCLKLSQGM